MSWERKVHITDLGQSPDYNWGVKGRSLILSVMYLSGLYKFFYTICFALLGKVGVEELSHSLELPGHIVMFASLALLKLID